MGMPPSTSKEVRIIVLAGWDGRARRLAERCAGPGRNVVATDNAYGAAVDILRGGPTVMIVDLLSVRQSQLGVLTVAAGQDVPRLGVGRPEAQGKYAEALAPVSPEDLPAAVNAILAPPTEPLRSPVEPEGSSVQVAVAPTAQAAPEQTEPDEASAKEPAARAPEQAAKVPEQAADVLTPEEVSALLEGPSP